MQIASLQPSFIKQSNAENVDLKTFTALTGLQPLTHDIAIRHGMLPTDSPSNDLRKVGHWKYNFEGGFSPTSLDVKAQLRNEHKSESNDPTQSSEAHRSCTPNSMRNISETDFNKRRTTPTKPPP